MMLCLGSLLKLLPCLRLARKGLLIVQSDYRRLIQVNLSNTRTKLGNCRFDQHIGFHQSISHDVKGYLWLPGDSGLIFRASIALPLVGGLFQVLKYSQFRREIYTGKALRTSLLGPLLESIFHPKDRRSWIFAKERNVLPTIGIDHLASLFDPTGAIT